MAAVLVVEALVADAAADATATPSSFSVMSVSVEYFNVDCILLLEVCIDEDRDEVYRIVSSGTVELLQGGGGFVSCWFQVA